MTDAMACWFLKQWELCLDPQRRLRQLTTERDFIDLIAHEREERTSEGVPLMRNDDVTLIVAQLNTTTE
jgi:hypothetical protein